MNAGLAAPRLTQSGIPAGWLAKDIQTIRRDYISKGPGPPGYYMKEEFHMRTLKKTLCLVLALVMVLGLCAFNVSAAEFTDATQIEYKEAVGVMQAAGVLSGFEDGSFRPEGTLTRAQAATMIACMMGFSGLKGKTEFTDCQGHWAEGAIAFCASEGIVSGYGDGTFGPNDTLTGSQWAVMLVAALGYNHKAEGITGASWEIGVTKMIKSLHLADTIVGFDGTKPISRDQACELGFNTMKAGTVKYTPGIVVNGVEIPGTTSAPDEDDTLLSRLGIVKNPAGGEDAFGRPIAYTWEDNNLKTADKTVYEVATPALATVSGGSLAVPGAIAKAAYLKGVSALDTVYTNGNETTNVDPADLAIVGATVEFYSTKPASPKIADTAVVITYEMATVNAISAKTGRITLSNMTIDKPAAGSVDANYDAVKDFAVKDVLAMCVNDDDDILSVVKAGTVEGKVTARNETQGTVTMSGTKYTVADGIDIPALGSEGTLYLDPNGFVIGFELKGAVAGNYVYVVKNYTVAEVDAYGIQTPSYYVQAVDMTGKEVSYLTFDDSYGAAVEGTLMEVKADTAANHTGMYVFTDDLTDENAEIVEAGKTGDGVAIKATDKRIDGTYFTSDVIFVYVSGTGSRLKVTVKSGVQAVAAKDSDSANIVKTYVAKTTGNTATTSVVFVASAYETPVATTSDVAFVFGDTESKSSATLTDKDGKAVIGWEKTVYIDGEKTTIYVKNAGAITEGFWTVSKNGDLTELKEAPNTATNLVKNATFVGYYGGTLSFNDKDIAVAADVTVVNLTAPNEDPAKDHTDAGLADLKNATISVVLSADGKTVTTVYITEISAVIG